MRLGALDGACRAAAGGTTLTLAPGTYTAVVLGATERGEGVGMALPRGVLITSIERGPSMRLSEADLQLRRESFRGCWPSSDSSASSSRVFQARGLRWGSSSWWSA